MARSKHQEAGTHAMGSHMSETNPAESSFSSCSNQCGKSSCVTFYGGEQCFFCEPTKGMLRDMLSQFQIPFTCVLQVDVDEEETITKEESILALPTIKICGETIVGLPDEGTIRDAVVRALMNECFCI